MQADMLIADKAFDADARVIAPLAAAGKTTVIPSKANRQSPRDLDREVYKERHLIENFFAKLKQFRAPGLRRGRLSLPATKRSSGISSPPFTSSPQSSGSIDYRS
jgi:transposase